MRTRDSGICKHDIQPSIALECIVHNRLDGGLVRGIELAGVNLAGGIERLDLPLVVAQIFVVKVTNIDGFCAVLGELVCCCSPYAYGRVGALIIILA